VVIGLLVSVPVVVLGSRMVLQLVERFPAIMQLGAAVLAFAAARMIVEEPLLRQLFHPYAVARWSTYALCVAGVLLAGWLATRGRRPDAR